jgi:peptidoglycan hydrolase-like protein with peptidoglycan-binding domain
VPPVDPTNMRRWAPAVVAVVAFAGVAGWGALARGTSGGGSAATSPTDAAQPVSASVTPVETTVPGPTTTIVQRPLPRELVKGATGEDVKMVQQRLYDIGFDPGGVDGVYGTSTIQAVWAFEKLVLGTPPDKVTGQVTPAIWQRMEQPLGVQPLRPNGSPTHVEVYLPQQVLVVFRDNSPILISHISTGSNQDWCEVVKVDNDDGTQTEKGICGKSITPGGVFSFNRRRAGWREGELGRMWNPVYFNYGIAVHGAGNVPSYPASHGCVRIPMHIGNYFPSLVKYGDQVFVFDGIKEPEAYGAQVPPFNTPDPNYTTTTSSTTTTTTVAPTTRPAPTQAPTTPAPPPPTEPPTTPAPASTAAPGNGQGGEPAPSTP